MAITFDSIGTVSFIRLDGDIDVAKTELAECTRPGVNGRAYRDIGARAAEVELTGIVDVADAASAALLHTTYASMVGSVVSVVKSETAFSNYLVKSVRVTNRNRCSPSVGGTLGGGATYLVTSSWVLVKAGAA